MIRLAKFEGIQIVLNYNIKRKEKRTNQISSYHKNMWSKYRKFTSVDEAKCWGQEFYSYWLIDYQIGGKLRGNYNTEHPEEFLRGKFSKEEKRKLKEAAVENKWFSYYCGGSWGLAINQKQRNDYTEYQFPEEELAEMQDTMDKRLNNSRVPENIWGYRFLNYGDLCKSTQKAYINCGAVIEDRGYMGVGLVKSLLEEEMGPDYDTLLKIMIPQGAKGLYIDLISNRVREQEVLFARGSKLRVLFAYRYMGKRIIICKMLKF